MSLRATATAARIDPSQLSRVERGDGSLSLDSLVRLAVVLDLSDLVALLSPYVEVPGQGQP